MLRFAFYGRLADVMGRTRTLDAPHPEMKVGEAIALLSAQDGDFRDALKNTRAKYAVNNSIVDPAFIVRSGDEIAVLPPFSGG